MSDFTRYDPSETIGPGRTIIEAGAGTGKTFTIAAAVTRLVAEEGVALERILVVTFTVAATAELKDRIRRRMVDTLRALQNNPAPGPPDAHMQVLLGASGERRARYAGRLDEAVTRFDRAQIFTIHGFARRLLLKLGFRSRLSGDLEPGEIDELLVRRAAADLVVARFAGSAAGGEIMTVSPGDLADIGKALVGMPDARIVPDPILAEGRRRVRAEMARDIREVLAERLRAAGMVTFDDGLVEARDALSDPRVGASARDLLRRSYSIALVDESQDTDPIQWQVIRAVFDDSRLVVIGDPKQSIYTFRGADIESYLAAAGNAASLRTLDTNWRSDGPLIATLDVLLEGATFGDRRIGYRSVRPADAHRAARIVGAGPPLEIRRFSSDFPLPTYQRRPFFLVNETRRAVAADVAAEVVRLLTGGVRLIEEGAERPVGPGDIAVLCRTRRQVETVREELDRRQVPSVAARTGGVFVTPAAEQWRRFLLAVERPSRLDYVCMAATTPMVGLSLAEVADLRDDDAPALQRRFLGWQALLHEYGVPTLFKDVDLATGLTERVLAEPGGERLLTDLAHIAEEMHAVWRRGRIGSLVVWIEAVMEEAARNAEANVEDPESRQRRLETDAAAVQVQTIHAAKGLEYPVVMAPYLWDIPRIRPRIPIFHDPEPAPPGEPRPRLVDVGGHGSELFDTHQRAAMAEEAAEEGRLLYVALTRAKHRLVIWWIENTKNSALTKLHEIITRGGDPDRAIERLIERSGGAISQRILAQPQPPGAYDGEWSVRRPLERARLDRPLDYRWRRVSFSSLSPDHPLGGVADTTDEPDRIDEPEDGATPTAAGSGLPMADLPRGARFGSLVHEIFRRVPFDAPDLAGAIGSELLRLTRHSSWDFETDTFVDGIMAAMSTPLGPGGDTPTLRDLDPARTLKEMDFELPLRTSASTISLRDIAGTALEHLPGGDPHRTYFERLAGMAPQPFRGFMTGGIDLISVLPGPGGDRYTVMDFKSNTLPARGEAADPTDYGAGPLVAAMHHGNYTLQALLYQVALHRYLRWRLPGYDPSVHLGGSMYLFIRGMIGPGTPLVEGERCGVERWRPTSGVVVAVSRLFAGRA